MPSVGTRDWVESTGGRLRFVDKLAIYWQIINARLGASSKVGPLLTQIELEDLAIPDSSLALHAAHVASELSGQWLVNHCYRTFLWGALLAKAHSIRFDPELLFVSAMLHDLGLVEPHIDGRPGEHCFAVTGGRRASETMRGAGMSQARSDLVEEAIFLHLNIGVPLKYGAEAHLLNAGAYLDVVGGRRDELGDLVVERVVAAYPRLAFKNEITSCLTHQRSIRPNSRMGFYVKNGMARRVKTAPFDS